MSQNANIKLEHGYIDRIDLLASSVLRITGWTSEDPTSLFVLKHRGHPIEPTSVFRLYRPDVSKATGSSELFLGFGLDYMIPDNTTAKVHLLYRGRSIYKKPVSTTGPTHYPALLTTEDVLGREGIYGIGPPASHVTPEVMALAMSLPDPILDFGCGGCALLRAFMEAGKEVRGIELAGTEAAAGIPEDLRPFVTTYDGRFPMPFPDGAFASVVASEVIEHMPNYQDAIRDIARVASRQALFTVPDNSVLPVCAPHGLIPWHYLASDHCNFFTQHSLAACLRSHFERVQFSRGAQFEVEGLPVCSNLQAMCYKTDQGVKS
jgi:SAM-dependent methyltransferase